MTLFLALGAACIVVLPAAALAAAGRFAYTLWQGRRLDRSGGGQ